MLKIKYPKFTLLMLTFVIAYFIFRGHELLPFNNFILGSGYLGVFLAGIFFAYGFTAAPATAIMLLLAKGQNVALLGFTAGLGALVGDLLIFKFIRYSFADEIRKLSKERAINNFNHKIPKLLKKYLVAALAGFIIASPLPDEVGVSLLAFSHSISTRRFMLLSYVLNTAGIFVILLIGRAI